MKRNCRSVLFSAALILSCWIGGAARGATLYVDVNSTSPALPYASWSGAATTIQDAVDVALSGDTVLVTNGVYGVGGRAIFNNFTNRVAIDKPITVLSVNGPQFTWIVGQGPAGSDAIRCAYITNSAVLAGFTLTGGFTRTVGDDYEERSGGGAYCPSGAVLSNCTIVGNAASLYGGGCFNAALDNCTVRANTGSSGGGMDRGSARACVVTENRATGLYGGGFNLVASTNCMISANVAFSGGGVAQGTAINCTILSNSAASAGGGIWNETAVNCIIYGNGSPSGANVSGGAVSFSCTIPSAAGPGNFTSFPLFVDPATGDFRLQSNSPCIDSGTTLPWMVGSVDLDGNPRISGAAVDIGAYEVTAPPGRMIDAVNLALGKPVTPLSNVVLGDPANVVDGDSETLWYSYQGTFSQMSFTLDLEREVEIGRIRFRPMQTETYVIETSTDNVTWTNRHSGTLLVWGDNETMYTFDVRGAYSARYIRYTSANTGMAYVGLTEIQVFGMLPAGAPDGLTGWWPGEGNCLDMSTNHNHGTPVGGVSFTNGRVGQAFLPDGVSGYVSIPSGPGNDFHDTTPMSLALWVYRTDGAGVMHLIAKRDGTGTMQYQLAFDGNGFSIGTHNGVALLIPGWSPPLNEWVHVAATFDGTDFRIYRNGVLAATGAGTLGPTNDAPLEIGGLSISGTNYPMFNGRLDEVVLYNRALSANEIQTLYSLGEVPLRAVQSCPRYISPGTNIIQCQFSYPTDRQLEALLWRPTLPQGWTLGNVAGDGSPQAYGNEIVFSTSDFTGMDPITFWYEAIVPADEFGTRQVDGTAEYFLNGMINPETTNATPLLLERLEYVDVYSEFNVVAPGVGRWSYFHGSPMFFSVTGSPVVAIGGATQYVCTGWTGTGSIPASGVPSLPPYVSITNDSSITWNWATQVMVDVQSAGTNGSLVVSSPSTNSGNGWFDIGTTGIVVTAFPSNGFHFVGWIGDVVTNINPLVLTADRNYAVTGVFAVNMYNITAPAAGTNGAIYPTSTVQVAHGFSTNLAIVPSNHYHIADVVVDGFSVGPTNAWTFSGVTNGHTISATFAIDTYTLSVTSTFGGAAPAGVTTNLPWNSPVAAFVTNSPVGNGPATQYVCVGWTGAGSVSNGAGTNVSFAITNDSSIAWNWKTQVLLSAVSAATNGSVTAPNGWPDMGTTGIVVTAFPSNGFHFVGWVGDVVTNINPLVLTADRNYAVTGVFAVNMYNITAPAAGTNGAIYPTGTVQVAHGFSTNLVIVPSNHYHVADVVVDGSSVGPTNAWTFSGVTNDHTISATFAIDTYTLSVSSTYGGALPAGVSTNNPWNAAINASVTNSPVANGPGTQYVCIGWTGTGSASNGAGTNTSFAITNDTSIAWNWKTQVLLTAVSAGTNGSVVAPNGWLDMGTTGIVVTAFPSNGFHFVGWIGDVVTNANPLVLTADRSYAVTGVFDVNMYTITAPEAGTNGAIYPTGTVQVAHGFSTNLVVVPSNHYHIADVVVDGSFVGPTNSWTFSNVTNDHTISATFAIDTYTLSVTSTYAGATPAGVSTNNPWNAVINASAARARTIGRAPDAG